MTVDAIALCRDRPDLGTALDVLGVPQVRPLPRAPLVQLCDRTGHPLVTVVGPVLVDAPGEVERLLGVVVDGPVWWVEARARDRAAHELARRVVEALAAVTRGRAWTGP